MGQSVAGLAAITFDDGYAGVVQYAWPILRALHVPATVFVISDAPGNLPGFWWDSPRVLTHTPPRTRDWWLFQLKGDQLVILPRDEWTGVPRALRLATWEMLASAVRSGLDVGCHSASHRTLTQLTDEELLEEIETSRETIRSRLLVAPEWFSYPFGMWDRRI